MQVAYTNHIGHSSRDTHSGKSNAISTVSDLGATERHNNHDYSEQDVVKMQSNINLALRHLNKHYQLSSDGQLVEVEGQLDLEGNVRKIYEKEFHEAIEKYNAEQIKKGHPERQIVSYIDKISEDKQQEVAVEGLLQIGSLDDWENKTIEDRRAVAPILIEMLKATLEELNKNENGKFVLAGASLHLNEGTPHIHYVGVPVQESPESKRGLEKRVKKTAVFTKDTLGTGLQDNVRAKIEPMIEDLFGWTFIAKKTGRNEDRDKNTQVNEILKEQIREKQEMLTNIQNDVADQKQNLAKLQEDTEKAHAELEKTRAELVATAQTNQSLKALNASKLKIIDSNNATIAEQAEIFEQNEETIAEQRQELADLRERVGAIQTFEEYSLTSDEIEERTNRWEQMLEFLKNAPKLFRRKEADNFIDYCKQEVADFFRWIAKTLPLVKDYEKEANLPDEKRRSPSLEAHIASAERQVGLNVDDSDFRRKRKNGYDGQSSDDR